jgi:hypothetical protein
VCSVGKLNEILFCFLGLDEALVYAFEAQKANFHNGGSGKPSHVQTRLWGLYGELWENTERIVRSCEDQMIDLQLPVEYVQRLNEQFNSEG